MCLSFVVCLLLVVFVYSRVCWFFGAAKPTYLIIVGQGFARIAYGCSQTQQPPPAHPPQSPLAGSGAQHRQEPRGALPEAHRQHRVPGSHGSLTFAAAHQEAKGAGPVPSEKPVLGASKGKQLTALPENPAIWRTEKMNRSDPLECVLRNPPWMNGWFRIYIPT